MIDLRRRPLALTGVGGGGFWSIIASTLETVAKHIFTASDGDTYAVGRVLGIVMLAFGLLAPTAGAIYLCFTDPPTWEDFDRLLQGMGFYLGLVAAAVVALITLTAPTEPKPPTASVTRTTDGDRMLETRVDATDPAPAVVDDPAPRVT